MPVHLSLLPSKGAFTYNAPPNNGMHPTPHHEASHVSCAGARVMPSVGRNNLEWLVSNIQYQMRVLTSRLIIASLALTIALAGAGLWFAYRAPAVQTLGLPPC